MYNIFSFLFGLVWHLFPKQSLTDCDEEPEVDQKTTSMGLRASDAPHYHLYSLKTGNDEYVGGAFSKLEKIHNLYDQYGPIEKKYWKNAVNS